MQRIRKGDEVVVLSGRDKGKRGTVLRRVDADHVVVEGVNRVKKNLPDAPIVIGLSTYSDDLTARTRVGESIEAERQDGAKITEVDVGKQKGTLIEGKDEKLLIGYLGKSTFVVRSRHNFIPQERLMAILPVLAQLSMTPPV